MRICSGAFRVALGRRRVLDDGVEQRLEGLAAHVRVETRLAVTRDGVDDREAQLVLVRVEIDEQVVDLVEHLLHARVRAVDLVDDDDRLEPPLERLAQHEPRLRQRALRGVDEEHHAVDHRQGALDLAPEVGVAGGVARC